MIPNPLGYLHGINHNPIDTGDNLALPPVDAAAFPERDVVGFPTWRETLSFSWADPTRPGELERSPALRPHRSCANVCPVNDLLNGTLPGGTNCCRQ